MTIKVLNNFKKYSAEIAAWVTLKMMKVDSKLIMTTPCSSGILNLNRFIPSSKSSIIIFDKLVPFNCNPYSIECTVTTIIEHSFSNTAVCERFTGLNCFPIHWSNSSSWSHTGVQDSVINDWRGLIKIPRRPRIFGG